MAFYVGQRVVCVDNKGQRDFLQNGQTYTIERGNFVDNDKVFVWIAGVCVDCPILRGFFASRFRPLVEKKTDISVFTALLKPRRVTRTAIQIVRDAVR